MQVTSEGSVRVDLVGGTLDLPPINLILPNVITLNVATSLKAHVQLEIIDSDKIEIHSFDYEKKYIFQRSEITNENLFYTSYFKEMSFTLQILDLFGVRGGLKVSLRSGAPPGSGLGGSSAMGMTLLKALAKMHKVEVDTLRAIERVRAVESRILNQGVPGYQDYFPAMLGGILCLSANGPDIKYKQLFTQELKEFLEDHITLIYSGIQRDSGINNWEVYKGFFDGASHIREALREIACVSSQVYGHLKEGEWDKMLELIGREGELRKKLSPSIVPVEVEELFQDLLKGEWVFGLKMCGAGGGGCFILTHKKENKKKLILELEERKYKVLDFIIEKPL